MMERYCLNKERKTKENQIQTPSTIDEKQIHEIRFQNPGNENKCYANSIVCIIINMKQLTIMLLDKNIGVKIRDGRGELVQELARLMRLPNQSVESTTRVQRIVTKICKTEFPRSARDFIQSLQFD